MDEITLEFMRKIDYLHLATSLARAICVTIRAVKIDNYFINAVELAVNEACVNAIKHSGCTYASRTVNLSFYIFDDRLVVNIKERGKGYDIDKVQKPEVEKHPESGYGIYIIKSIMDKVEYKREKDRNVLSMTKYFKGENKKRGT